MTVIIGHRGAAGHAPENTLPSFRKAIEQGVRTVECDVRLTRDGFAVCLHDDRLDRVTPETGYLADWAWEAVSQVPVLPGAFGGAYPEARIPLLAEVLRALPKDTGFLVELKKDPVRGEELVRRTLEIIDAAGARERCRVISFEQDLLRLCRESLPPPRVGGAGGLNLAVIVGARGDEHLLERAREVEAEAIHPHQSLVTPELLAAARAGGFRVNAWTVNSGEEVRRLAALGVEEITTDYPDMALAAAEQ